MRSTDCDPIINPELVKMGSQLLRPFTKKAFVPGGDPAMGGGAPPPGGDPAAMGGMPPGGDPAAMGGMPPPGGDPAAMGGAPPMDPAMMGAPPPPPAPPMDPSMLSMIQQSIQTAMAASGVGQTGQTQSGGLKPKIDVNVAIVQILKMLARIADALNINIPASEMVITPPDLNQFAQKQQASGQQDAGLAGAQGPIQPIQPMVPSGGGGAPKQAAYVGHDGETYDLHGVGRHLQNSANAAAILLRNKGFGR